MSKNKTEIHNERGIELATKGWKQEALREFEKAIEADPNYAPAYDNIADLYAREGDYLSAMKIYLKAIELDPENAVTRYNFGCFISNHASAIALSEYQEAVAQDTDFPEAHLNLGLSLASHGRHSEAIEAIKFARDLEPNEAQYSYELACVLLEQGELREAIGEFRRTIKNNSEFRDAWISLAACYREQGLRSEAAAALNRARKLGVNKLEL